ncbi:MAG: 4Fe-4S dicluster domain-containing protein [Armatimonadota bacterium]
MSNFVDKIKDAGVIGAGGAGFPSYVKYQSPDVDYIIANGAECEPLLCVDKHIMETKAKEIVGALSEAVEFLKAKGAFIALKGKNKDAVKALECEISKIDKSRIKVFILGDFYPAGDEFVMTYEVLKRIVPEGGIPIKVGTVVNNVFTFVNIYNALKGIPVTERIVTVNGRVKEPYTAYLPVGISVKDALKLAGGPEGGDYKVILGGPMMGKIIDDLSQPVTQTTSGIIVLPSDHVLIRRKERALATEARIGRSACDQCRMCTDTCPRYLLGHDLEPHMIMRTLPYKNISSDTVSSAYLCCECNLCAYYSCPLFLSPGVIAANLKKELASAGVKRQTSKKEDDYRIRIFRNYRRIPTGRLISRIGLADYKKDAKFKDIKIEPSKVKMPLKAHIGAPSMPSVKIGSKVKKDELIAKAPEGALGVNLYASIDGKIADIKNGFIEIIREN